MVGSFKKLLNSLLCDIIFKNACELFSNLKIKSFSIANSYKANEYLLTDVIENPLFLLNFHLKDIEELLIKYRFN